MRPIYYKNRAYTFIKAFIADKLDISVVSGYTFIRKDKKMEQTNIKKLARLAKSEAIAAKFVQWTSHRRNNAAETTIEQLARNLGVSYREARDFARALEELSFCEYTIGRKGYSSRVTWLVKIKSIAAAIDGVGEIEAVSDDDDELYSPEEEPLTISGAKIALAKSLGVEPEAIEITVKA